MDDQPKEPNARDYLICLVQQVDEQSTSLKDLHAKVDDAVRYRKEQDRSSRFWNGAIIAVEWTTRLGGSIGAIFVASYVAVEHSWYIAKIGGWLHKLGSFF